MKNRKQETGNRKQVIDIDYVAKLANLPLSASEKKVFNRQLADVLGYFEKLKKLKTEGVEPIGHITGLINVTREDKAAPSISQEEALVNAPKTYNGFFEVEAIFEENNPE